MIGCGNFRLVHRFVASCLKLKFNESVSCPLKRTFKCYALCMWPAWPFSTCFRQPYRQLYAVDQPNRCVMYLDPSHSWYLIRRTIFVPKFPCCFHWYNLDKLLIVFHPCWKCSLRDFFMTQTRYMYTSTHAAAVLVLAMVGPLMWWYGACLS